MRNYCTLKLKYFIYNILFYLLEFNLEFCLSEKKSLKSF